MNEAARKFTPVKAARGEEPLSVGMIGPPGGGKTYSALRLANGIADVRGGDVILIDTEAGRSRKLAEFFDFLHVDFAPPHRPAHFAQAIIEMAARNPAAIIVDSMSDEHEGIGGYLEYHDELVPKLSGNEWAAWARPKAERKRLITRILQIKVPLIFTFRAREKTKQVPDEKTGKMKVIPLGWQPVAPLEIVHTLDLTCVLPPRAEGLPVWHSDKIGEDFVIKLPQQFKALFEESRQLDESHGRALGEWARGAPDVERPPLLDRAREAAGKGDMAFTAWYHTLSSAERKECATIGAELRTLMVEADERGQPVPGNSGQA